jgi:hypothetical protein
MNLAFVRRLPLTVLALAAVAGGSGAHAQVVYYGAMRPVIAAPVVAAPVAVAPAYVANYTPAGNYAAVTAFSPPVMAEPAAIAVRSGYAPVFSAPVAVTSYYAPAPVAPTVAYYAPPAVAPVVAAPVTTYYAPSYAPAYAPGVLYRRGPLGVYRPVRSAYYIPY